MSKPKKPKLTLDEKILRGLARTADGYAAMMELWATKGYPLRKLDNSPDLDDMGRQRYRGLTANEAKQVHDFLKRHPAAIHVRQLKRLSTKESLEEEARQRFADGRLSPSVLSRPSTPPLTLTDNGEADEA